MLWQRLLVAAILAPLLLWAAGLEPFPGYAAALAVFALVGAGEFFRMVQRAGHHPAWALGVPLAVLLAVLPLLPEAAGFHIVALCTFAALAWTAFRHGRENGLLDWALTVAPAIYVGGLLAYYLLLRQFPHGDYWVRTVFLCTWGSDTAAYLVGRRWGHIKIAPALSPNKSLEGAIAGVIAPAASAAAIVLLWPVTGLPLGLAVLLGLLIGVAAIVGDLAESFIKRQLGAKDSSRLLLGHGGLLDRLDSLLATGMVAYYYLWAFGR